MSIARDKLVQALSDAESTELALLAQAVEDAKQRVLEKASKSNMEALVLAKRLLKEFVIEKTKKKMFSDFKIPDSIYKIRSRTRIQLLNNAVQAAKLLALGSDDVYLHFLNFCEMVSGKQESVEEKNVVSQFVEVCCEVGSGLTEQAGPLYGAFENWHKEEFGKRSKVPGKRIFSDDMKIKFKKDTSGRHTFYIGIALEKEKRA